MDYSSFNYWRNKEIDESQGELSPDSMFLLTSGCAPMPCCCSFNKFSYCDNPEFAAGYLKYVVLGLLAIDLLLDYDKEYFELPDIDDVIEQKLIDKYDVIGKIKVIVELCNSIFCEEDEEKQKEYLKCTSQKFNEFFEFGIQDVSGRNYTFDVYDGSDAVRNKFLGFLAYSELLPQITKIFSKNNWSVEDKRIIKNAVDYIL